MFNADAKILDKGALEKKLLAQLANKAGRKRAQIGKLVQETIDAVLTKHKKLFIPDEEEVGELGIGLHGSPDNQKIRNAWKGLQVGNIGDIKLNFQKTANSSNFGIVSYKVDKDAFYRYKDCLYTSTRGVGGISEGTEEVEWMRHFMEGLEVRGYAYINSTDPGFKSNRSRTGIGHMVKTGGKIRVTGRHFKFVGTGSEKFEYLKDQITRAFLSTSFSAKLRKIIGG